MRREEEVRGRRGVRRGGEEARREMRWEEGDKGEKESGRER